MQHVYTVRQMVSDNVNPFPLYDMCKSPKIVMFSLWKTGGFETVGTAPSCGSLRDGRGVTRCRLDPPRLHMLGGN